MRVLTVNGCGDVVYAPARGSMPRAGGPGWALFPVGDGRNTDDSVFSRRQYELQFLLVLFPS